MMVPTALFLLTLAVMGGVAALSKGGSSAFWLALIGIGALIVAIVLR